MSDIWFTADSHFGHARIIEYCDRPFHNTHEMDETLIENWNKFVKPNDLIWHLGDVFLCGSQRRKEIMSRLNGKKKLILGNHDKLGRQTFIDLGFEEVYKKNVQFDYWIASHYPLEKIYDLPNVHGHVHSKIDGIDQSNHKCICVELTNYSPIHIDELIFWAKSIK